MTNQCRAIENCDFAHILEVCKVDSSFDATERMEKLLRRAERRIVQFLDAIQQAKAHAEFCMQRLSVVTNNLKPAAFRGTLWSKRADEHMATRLHCARHLANVGKTLVHRRKEMKHGAVRATHRRRWARVRR